MSDSMFRDDPARLAARRRRMQGGFTLVEMIVSLTAGLMIASAAFLLARNSSSFFAHEAGITGTQFGAMLGLTRMQADLRRAGFMASPNVQTDDLLCGDWPGYPAGMEELAGVYIEKRGSEVRHAADHALSNYNGLDPDALILAGMFGTTEQFAVDVMSTASSGAVTIVLQWDGALWRNKLGTAGGGLPIVSIFSPGRYIRIVDQEGRIGFGIIDTVTDATHPNKVVITVLDDPQLPSRNHNVTCGCEGHCTGALVNPVVRVLYDLRTVTNARYAGLYAQADLPTTVAPFHRASLAVSRTELVRVELLADNSEVNNTLEVLAEYVVDLKFGITARVNNGLAPFFLEEYERYPIGDARVYPIADTPGASGTPEDIRAVQVRLSTRAPKRDRDFGIGTAADGGLYRYSLGLNEGFARMRTFHADVALPNLGR